MQLTLKKTALASFILGLSVLPRLVLASQVTLTNPLGEGVTDPRVIIGNVIQAILSIIGSLALLMFVYGGVIWITSFGDAKRIEKGKTILTWAVLGLAIIASAYVIVNALIQGLTEGSATGV